jgi:hypothetical protein
MKIILIKNAAKSLLKMLWQEAIVTSKCIRRRGG